MKNILVVDDSSINLKLVESVLKNEYKLIMVKSGAEAIQYLEKNPVDMVLLDIMMPDMDGYETYERIRQIELNRDVPVVFLAADMDSDNEIKGLEMGAVDFIRKPFVPEVMLNRIRRILCMEEEVKKTESIDYLTGLLGRREGERKVIEAIRESNGVLAFIDLDNLKRTNDTMGHLAGDYALKTVGEVLSEYGENAIASRIGGDEFLFYMKDVNEDEAVKIVKQIIDAFERRKEGSTFLSVSSLSMGLCSTVPTDVFTSVLKKADRALYYVKQSGKCGYYLYTREPDETTKKSSIDLDRLVNNLKTQGNYSGALSVEYREFAKIYDFINHLGERYDYNVQLIMITLDTGNQESIYVDERERAMICMEKTIQASLRTVDVCTRFSSEQFIVILTNAQSQDIDMITSRISDNFYKIYDRKMINVHFNVAELTNLNK